MIEVIPEEIEILSEALHPPFEVAKEHPVGEEVRMKYRYIDLRRQSMKNNIIQRHKILHRIFNFLSDKGFLYIETPYLIKNTPEGAREFVVPSRFSP
jgi:aspartyl-tRNA synthetase